jgi:hypothetical protein
MVLKHAPGTEGQSITAFGFSEGDAQDWLIGGQPAAGDGQTVFDGTARLKVQYVFAFGYPEALGDGYMAESETVDFTPYKKVEVLNLDY